MTNTLNSDVINLNYIATIRAQFPILQKKIEGNALVYLDNAATTQKPQTVIDAITDFYTECNANVHRGAHYLSDEATQRYEQARDTVATFIDANNRKEVIWTSGTTESINLVAHGIAQRLKKTDEVLITEMEHHANLVTWQQACHYSGATLKIAPIDDNGTLNIDAFISLINEKTQLVAFPHISNALGTINPIKALTEAAKKYNALVLIDGAQGIAHEKVNVSDIGCDFYAFSGHKLFAPTGIGVLWGKESVLNDWPVWQVGGEMIAKVDYQTATWGELPNRLEAGTPNIAGAIGLGAAIKWFTALDFQKIHDHEQALMQHALTLADKMEQLTLVGNAKHKVGVFSFTFDGLNVADIGFILDKQGIAIRTGDHCAQPLIARLGVSGTARASFSLYNTFEEIDAFFVALKKAQLMLS